MPGNEQFRERITRLMKEFTPYMQMPLQDKLRRLNEFKNQKSELEKKLSDLGAHIFILETMPDVAEQQVKNDEVALALLKELRGKKEISYNNLVNGQDNTYQMIISHYLFLLQRAMLVELNRDPDSSADKIIKLTERGRTIPLRYSR
ncbi:MAG TPA: hypothetical protein VJ142_00590 [Candidatus Nanoarchaeia archaeon]|nr:hypothetical protein [Candidatus Nanoarchaeia archaeon]